MKRPSFRWTALLGLALTAWLWLAAVHVHVDASTTGGHPVCELCAGLDRAAAPPPTVAALLPPHGAIVAIALPDLPGSAATPAARYSSRAPPLA